MSVGHIWSSGRFITGFVQNLSGCFKELYLITIQLVRDFHSVVTHVKTMYYNVSLYCLSMVTDK